MAPLRILFASYHAYLDSSSGAAIATQELLQLLAARGHACGVLSGPQLDFATPPSIPDVLRNQGLSATRESAELSGCTFSMHHFRYGLVPVTWFVPEPLVPHREPTSEEGKAFLRLFVRTVRVFRPDVVLTYGGHWLAATLLQLCRRAGQRVVFALHNASYTDGRLFRAADAVLVPSNAMRRHYHSLLKMDTTAIAGPWDWHRVQCDVIDPRFVTFINPQYAKGLLVVARLISELGARRPDIPFLIVDGRSPASELADCGIDVRQMRNVQRMANTSDPRQIYRLSRMVLVPSLWEEAFARVTVEAMLNGIPVLGSDRGGIPEALSESGIVLPIPARYTPESRVAPQPHELRDWIATIESLWDDPVRYQAQQALCHRAARAFSPDTVLDRFEVFLHAVVEGRATRPFPVRNAHAASE